MNLPFRRSFISFLGEHVSRNRRPEEIKLVEISSPCCFTNFLPIKKPVKLWYDGAWGEVSGSSDYLLRTGVRCSRPSAEAPQPDPSSEVELCLQLPFSSPGCSITCALENVNHRKVAKNLQNGSKSALGARRSYFWSKRRLFLISHVMSVEWFKCVGDSDVSSRKGGWRPYTAAKLGGKAPLSNASWEQTRCQTQ